MTISQVCKTYDLTADTLRYYERAGLIPGVQKNKSGIRDYTESDLRWVEFAKCMRSAGLPIGALAEYVALFQQGDATAEARKAILVRQRDELQDKMRDMQKTLDRLNRKIDHYDQTMLPAEKRLKPAAREDIL